jgi:pyridoxamine 5'-phosphate oxidase
VEADRARPLAGTDLDPEPLRQFLAWFEQARDACPLPEAVALATATPEGRPSVRMVLLKSADEQGFTFFSAYGSRKGHDLDANPRAALCFYWHPLGRQVRVEGEVERVPPEESDEYFASRPLGARLSASVSRQSEVVASREQLEQAVRELAARVNDDVPRPSHWGGYRLLPETYEFWQHREDRLHDRFRYSSGPGGWTIERLGP